jgi:hypothetical protein
MYRYRLIDGQTGSELGPLIPPRLSFRPGELLARISGEGFRLLRTVPAENENFRAYLVVTAVEPAVSRRSRMSP